MILSTRLFGGGIWPKSLFERFSFHSSVKFGAASAGSATANVKTRGLLDAGYESSSYPPFVAEREIVADTGGPIPGCPRTLSTTGWSEGFEGKVDLWSQCSASKAVERL